MIDAVDVTEILRDFEHRCAAAKLVGGISAEDALNGKATVPDGWVLDMATDFFVPADFTWGRA